MVVVGVAMAEPLEVKGHAQVRQVQETDVVVPEGQAARYGDLPAQGEVAFSSTAPTYLDAVLTFTSRSPLKTNCPGFQSKLSLFHSQCRFSVVL